MVQSVSGLQCILPSFPTTCMWQYNLDLRSWKTIGIFLSSWWLIVPSCMILELTVHSVSCLQCFPSMWQYDLDLWPPILKNYRHLPLIMLIKWCFDLQGPDRQTNTRTTLYHNTSRQRRVLKSRPADIQKLYFYVDCVKHVVKIAFLPKMVKVHVYQTL